MRTGRAMHMRTPHEPPTTRLAGGLAAASGFLQAAARVLSSAAITPHAGSGVTSFRAHPFALIQQQAAALNLPHSVVEISGPDFSASYTAALRQLAAEGMEVRGGLHACARNEHAPARSKRPSLASGAPLTAQALATGDITDVCSGFMETAAANAQVRWHVRTCVAMRCRTRTLSRVRAHACTRGSHIRT